MLKDKIDWLVESWRSSDYVEHVDKHKPSEPSEGLTDWHHKVIAVPKHGHIVSDAIDRQHELEPEHSDAVADYQLDSSRLNTPIREGQKLSDKKEEQRKNLDHVTNSSLKHDTVMYRGASASFQHLPKGSEFKDKAYTGTSIDPKIAKYFGYKSEGDTHKTVARIFLKKGQKGAYLPHSKPNASRRLRDQSEDMNDELEFLMPRNTKFKVIGHSREPAKEDETYGTHYVNMEAHHEDEDK
jgi:hypothetical protein